MRVACGRAGTAVLLASSLFVIPSPVAAQGDTRVQFRPGAVSLHDPLTPGLGNGGYTVRHYDIRLRYRPRAGLLRGRTVVRARAVQDLSRFDLDFALPARSVTVNGRPAAFTSPRPAGFSDAQELVVTPSHGIRTGRRMTVVVTYAAKPGAHEVDGFSDWTHTATGIMAWDEPNSAAQFWFPGNDYPSDKATYDVRVTTPRRLTAVTNGRLLSRRVHGGLATSRWRTAAPMATYVSVLAIGRYHVHRSPALPHVAGYYAYEARGGGEALRARRDVSRTPAVLRFLQRQWGRYPYNAAGGLVVGYPYPSALETQTRPTYEVGLWQDAPHNMWAVVHENAHQWFGDSVTMRRWRFIWLAESFATYSEWVWSQARHDGSAESLFLATYHEHPVGNSLWQEPLDRPGYPLDLTVYYRGAMMLQALRNRVGTPAFYRIMRTWARRREHRNGTTAQFESLARQVSGRPLTAFFHAWITATSRPRPTAANGFPAAARAALRTARVPTPTSLAAISRSDAILAADGQ